MALPVYHSNSAKSNSKVALAINAELVASWLVRFLKEECIVNRSITTAVLGLSGGVDSAVVAALCAKAFGPENVIALRLPYKKSSPESLSHAQLLIDQLQIRSETLEITGMVDQYVAASGGEISDSRLGNVCARCRMIAIFDASARLNALPIGTGNKSERLFGYFTWHADDAPPINPLGDLFKTEVYQLAKYLNIPEVIRNKPASADLITGQTDEGDFGISYEKADQILHYIAQGYTSEKLIDLGFQESEVNLVWSKVAKTHWKRRLPTVAMLSTSAIGEYYLRPVDY